MIVVIGSVSSMLRKLNSALLVRTVKTIVIGRSLIRLLMTPGASMKFLSTRLVMKMLSISSGRRKLRHRTVVVISVTLFLMTMLRQGMKSMRLVTTLTRKVRLTLIVYSLIEQKSLSSITIVSRLCRKVVSIRLVLCVSWSMAGLMRCGSSLCMCVITVL